MTINQLIKKLEKIRDKHGKRLPVMADWDSFISDNYARLEVKSVGTEWISWYVEGSCELKDGSTRERFTVCLQGGKQ